MVLGVQEWPRADTDKRKAYDELISEKKLCQLLPEDYSGVGVVYTTQLGTAEAVEGFSGKAREIMTKCNLSPLELTTARKSFAFRFPNVVAKLFLVVHAKEPKDEDQVRMLADFIKAIGNTDYEVIKEGEQLVVMSDTNLSTEALALTFSGHLNEGGLQAVPGADIYTTAKKRSALHGQCYDEEKVHKMIQAPKDKVIAAEGALTRAETFPNLSSDDSLPTNEWASDHCLTHARLKCRMFTTST